MLAGVVRFAGQRRVAQILCRRRHMSTMAGKLAEGDIEALQAILKGMPKPVYDTTGGPAVQPQCKGQPGTRFQRGTLQRVVWCAWTGNNPMPAHLQLCVQTIQRNCGLEVILVSPDNMLQYVPDPHPAYQYLHLAHRADYLRCYLLHTYGGIWLDVDTICLRKLDRLFDRLEHVDCVGYDGSQWGEYIGISDMGPFRPGSPLTELWFGALHGILEKRMSEVMARKTDPFGWQEILRDIFVPLSLLHRDSIGVDLLAMNPGKEQLYSTSSVSATMGSEVDGCHILILNNALYGDELAQFTTDQILGGPAVLSQLLRRALGVPELPEYSE